MKKNLKIPVRKKTSKATAQTTAKKKKPRGRPTRFTPATARKIIEGLSKGTPLTIVCTHSNMPGIRTVYDWIEKIPGFSADIARARDAGWDQIALDALAIADAGDRDTITYVKNEETVEIPDKEWMMRSKLRVETRLKLLAKWDSKRYGEKVTAEISGPDGKPIKTEASHRISEDLQDAILLKTMAAAKIAANVEAPASFKGKSEEDG